MPIAFAHVTANGIGSAQLFFDREPPHVNETSKIHILLQDFYTAEPIADLDVVHERKMHVFIVGQDLKTFAHIHPEDSIDGYKNQRQGVYNLEYNFTKAGNYLLSVDYTTKGLSSLQFFIFAVKGNASLEPLLLDFQRQKRFDEYEVTLKAPENILVGNETELVYYIKKEGREVNNLQMYLGAEIHVAIVKDDLFYADHTHVYIPGHFVHSGVMSQHYVGPTIPVHVTFPAPGNYSLFGQFQHNNKTITTNFMVEVSANAKSRQKTGAFQIIFLVVLFVSAISVVVLFWVKSEVKAKSRK